MNTFPANEQLISDVERGRSCMTVVAVPNGETPAVGDSVLFALTQSRSGQPASYVKGGDSVVVTLTGVTPLNEFDPVNGRPLVRFSWNPLGSNDSAKASAAAATAAAKARRPQKKV